jgi:hypothetical protein
MAKEIVWNVVVDEMTYLVKLIGNKVVVNNNEPIKYTKLKRVAGKGANYEVPLGGRIAILHISTYAAPVLTLDGKDCSTGELYEEPQLPWWIWILIVLHVFGFIFLIGGAIGGAVGAVFSFTSLLLTKKAEKPLFKILIGIGVFVVNALVAFGIASLIIQMLS